MRNTIRFLVILLALLITNIVAYIGSEDYRFFLKKLKYQEEVVYDTQEGIDDIDRISVIDKSSEQVFNNKTIQTSGTGFSFFDALAGKISRNKEQTKLSELNLQQKIFLDFFSAYGLKQIAASENLFGISNEYPDLYYEWYSENLTLYAFPSKNYQEVKKIFEVLSFDFPFRIKETNQFAQASFFINLEPEHQDDSVRIVVEYEKNVFGLKIKKDSYNAIKQIFSELGAQ